MFRVKSRCTCNELYRLDILSHAHFWHIYTVDIRSRRRSCSHVQHLLAAASQRFMHVYRMYFIPVATPLISKNPKDLTELNLPQRQHQHLCDV